MRHFGLMSELSPTIRHRRLAAELRRLRTEAGISPEDAAAALGISRPQLVKIETARVKPSPPIVERILALYGRGEDHTLAVMQLVRNIHKSSWWQAYGAFLSGSFAELEEDADEMGIWNTELVPGLLQTRGYARALITAGDLLGEKEIDDRVKARIQRQAVLTGQNPPILKVVLDEAVLRRPIGGREVMREQLEALLEAGQQDNISIRVLPAAVGPHPGIGEGSFTIFKFPLPMDRDVVFLESAAGPIYVEDLERVRRSTVTHTGISEKALSEEDSAALIGATAKE